MKHSPFLPLVLLGLGALLLPAHADRKVIAPVGPPPVLLKPEAGGTYIDAAGKGHPWSVGQGHALTWDGLPYLPVGATVTPASWAAGAGDADWAADKITLDGLAKGGVRDVLLTAGARGLTHVPPAAVQRVLDYLDSKKISYGLKIADFPQDPLTGYVVKPAAYRNPSPAVNGPTQFSHIPDLLDAFYLLVSSSDGEIEANGAAQVANGNTAVVTPRPGEGDVDDVMLLYPRRLYLPGTPESRLPDLWQGYDEYRDRLLTFFGRVKLGPGFRFFIDPITSNIGLDGEVDNVIPTSDGFRLDFEAWLNKKYNHNVDDLNKGWGIKERDLPDFATAARCLPLWSGSKGVPAVWDPDKKVPYMVLNHPRIGGHVWDDFQQFRLQSVRGYMNSLAGVLKKSVANVPVVYGWGGRSPLFTNPDVRGGFDGLAVTDTEAAAYAFAQAEDTPRTTWLLSTSPTPLTASWETLKTLGLGGYFAPAATPAGINQLAQYAASLSFGMPGGGRIPRVLPYPAGVANVGVSLQQLPDGVWWLPSYRAGALFSSNDAFSLGPLVRGYRLNDPDGGLTKFVIWSPNGGLTQARFPFPKDSPALITDAAGVPLDIKKKGSVWTVPLSAEPIVISRVSSVPLPVDAAEAADKEVSRLIKVAKDQGLNVDLFQQREFQAKNSIPDTAQNADLRYNALARLVGDLASALQPYLWIEGEGASSYTFDSLVSDSEASGGSYLSLDTNREPSTSGVSDSGGYHADWKFRVNAAGTYALWAATSPLPNSSPFTYTLDGGGANIAQNAPEGDLYAGRFMWSQIGSVSLSRGPHTLTINVTGPRARDGRYVLAVDTLCLSRVPFYPNGTQPPAIEFNAPPVVRDKKGHIVKPKEDKKDKKDDSDDLSLPE